MTRTPGSGSGGGYPWPTHTPAVNLSPCGSGRDAAPRPQDASFARAVDNLLMERLAAGEGRALEQLYDRYHVLVYSVALRIVRDEMLAEDIVQEVFLRLWRRPESYDPSRGRFLSWLMSVTRNRAIDEVRRLSRRFRIEDRRPLAADRGAEHGPSRRSRTCGGDRGRAPRGARRAGRCSRRRSAGCSNSHTSRDSRKLRSRRSPRRRWARSRRARAWR